MYGLAQIAVLTRVLPVTGIGRAAILLFYSSLITHLCNLGFVTGTMLALPFGGRGGAGAGGGVDDGGDEEELEDKPSRIPAGDPRKLLGTGMSIALLLTAGLTALSIPLADPLSNLLLGDTRDSAAIVWATAVGGLATVWRMVTSVPRFERRPARYVAMQAGYWAVSLGAAAAFRLGGLRRRRRDGGIALGHAAADALGLWLARTRYRSRSSESPSCTSAGVDCPTSRSRCRASRPGTPTSTSCRSTCPTAARALHRRVAAQPHTGAGRGRCDVCVRAALAGPSTRRSTATSGATSRVSGS